MQLTGGPAGGSVDAAAELLAQHCAGAAVTLGERGCLVADRCGARLSEPAVAGVHVVDSTGVVQTKIHTSARIAMSVLFCLPLRRCRACCGVCNVFATESHAFASENDAALVFAFKQLRLRERSAFTPAVDALQ